MDSKTYDFSSMKQMIQRDMFGLPDPIVRMTKADNSGFNTKPLPNTHVPHHRRFNYLESKATDDIHRHGAVVAFVQHFEENIENWVQNCDFPDNGEWVELPDLYKFMRKMVLRAATDALYGPDLLRRNPSLEEDFWEFDANVQTLCKGVPRILSPEPYRIRERCVRALLDWRLRALPEEERTETSDLPEWNSKSGLKCNTLRNEMFKTFPEWTVEARANSDFSLMVGLNGNSPGAAFWYFVEILQSKDLYADAVMEVRTASVSSGDSTRFDLKKLLELPLLQSIYAETLRIYVTAMFLRKTAKDTQLGAFTVPQDSTVMLCSHSEQMNEKLWNPTCSPEIPAVTEFWGRRFLDEDPSLPDSGPRFKVEEISGGKWLPFGIGARQCPGRDMAKREIFLTFAVLSTYFDIEIMQEKGWKPKPKIARFGFGTMPPAEETPFRIRRRVTS